MHPDTRARVEAAARELGYRRNLAASRLAGGAANTFCILTDRLANVYHSALLDAFEAEATRAGFQCVLSCANPPEAYRVDYLEGLPTQGYDGFAMTPVWELPHVAPLMPSLLRGGEPVVFLDQRFPGHPGALVSCDHRAGARLMAEHLLDLGHRKVLFLAPASKTPLDRVTQRREVARDVLSGAGVTFDELAVPVADCIDAATAALRGNAAPTAIMCAEDLLANILIAGLLARGIRIPQDVSVSGFDDHGGTLDDLCAPPAVPLTTIRPPIAALGTRAADLLVASARGKAVTSADDLSLPGALVARESTAAAPDRP